MNKGILIKNLATCSHPQQRTISFGKMSEWYQRLWNPPAPKPPYKHICQIGDPVLRIKANSVDPKEVKSAYVQKVISRMKNVMHKYDAVGLAAPQIGVPLRIITIEFSASRKKEFDNKTFKARQMQTVPFKVLINPVLRITTQDKVKFPESCESVKGFSAVVPRYTTVSVKALNENGEQIEWSASGWPARIVQHEMDHLEGKFYTDHMDRESFNCAYWHSVNVRSGRFSLTFGPFKKW